jgi:endonuclease G
MPINNLPAYPVKVLDNPYFVFGYSKDFRNPAWEFYRVGRAVHFESPPAWFRSDPDTDAKVRTRDYSHTPFSRGRMAPNFAMGSRFGAEGARSTFVMSNVTPQYPSTTAWGDLEE